MSAAGSLHTAACEPSPADLPGIDNHGSYPAGMGDGDFRTRAEHKRHSPATWVSAAVPSGNYFGLTPYFLSAKFTTKSHERTFTAASRCAARSTFGSEELRPMMT